MGATTIVTRAGKGSALTHTEMDTNFTNLNNAGTYIGEIKAWPAATVPDSTFLECNGQSVTTAGYPLLFAIIGYTYGGSGANFNVPDYRGYMLRGWDHGAGVDPDRSSRTNRGDGTTGDNVGTKQADQLASHTHPIAQTSGNFGSTGGAGPVSFGPPSGWGVVSGATGGNETRSKNINVMWIIKAKFS